MGGGGVGGGLSLNNSINSAGHVYYTANFVQSGTDMTVRTFCLIYVYQLVPCMSTSYNLVQKCLPICYKMKLHFDSNC